MRIFIHGTGHKAASWKQTLSYMRDTGDILCPDLGSILGGKEASYGNLYSSFIEYCGRIDGALELCGLSLGGVLALNYALDFPERVGSLVLIGTPHKAPKAALVFQNIVFRLLPESAFNGMAFGKRDTLALGNSLKGLDLGARAQEVRTPTLVLCGEKDNINMKSAQFLARNITGARLRMIEGAGHAVNEEKPETLARALEEFYALVSTPGI